MDKDYKIILKNYIEYDYTEVLPSNKFTYQSAEDNNLKELKNKYNLDRIAGQENEFKRMSNLMVWVSDKLKYDGEIVIDINNFNSVNIIENTINKGISSNCWMYATVLNEVFLAMGFKSRMIRCMSSDLFDTECHCVTIVYSTEYKKWIMFDPANKAFFINRMGIPLSLEELRKVLINDEKFILPRAKTTDFEKIKQYWYKNIVRFHCYSHSAYNYESIKVGKTVYALNPSSIVIPNSVEQKDGFCVKYINTSNPDFFWKV